VFSIDEYRRRAWGKAEVLGHYESLPETKKGEVVAILSGVYKEWKNSREVSFGEDDNVFVSAIFFSNRLLLFKPGECLEISLDDIRFSSLTMSGLDCDQVHLYIGQRLGGFLDFKLEFDELRYFVDCFLRPSIEVSTLNYDANDLHYVGLVSGSWTNYLSNGFVTQDMRKGHLWQSQYAGPYSIFEGSQIQLLLEAWNLGATHILGMTSTLVREYEIRDVPKEIASSRNIMAKKTPNSNRIPYGQETMFLMGTAFRGK